MLLCRSGLPAGRTWRPGRPVDLDATLSPLRRGSGDPAYVREAGGAIWRALRTPEGAATVRLSAEGTGAGSQVCAQAWGPGSGWALDAVPSLLGNDDDAQGFVPRHPVVAEAARRHPGWRVPRTGLVLEALAPAVLEQKVTCTEAWRAWRHLLRTYGERAPGPAPPGMRVPPSAEQWRGVPSWEWHRAGVDGSRSSTLIGAAQVAGRLEQSLDLASDAAERRLRSLPGIGVWTAAEVRQRAHGDADAVSVGDFHLSALVGWALVGEPVDDETMLELLEPYAGHRYRAVRLIELSVIELSGLRPPRRGPRLPPRNYRSF